MRVFHIETYFCILLLFIYILIPYSWEVALWSGIYCPQISVRSKYQHHLIFSLQKLGFECVTLLVPLKVVISDSVALQTSMWFSGSF